MATQEPDGRRLVLVDALSAVYRAYFAIKGLSTKAGRPTNALFGFIRALRQICVDWAPSHMAVVFDGGLPAFRMELLPDYKAQRPPMPDNLREQLPLVERYLDYAGIAHVRIAGQEADDVLASMARWAAPDAEKVLIATTDKDLYQVVDNQIRMIGPSAKSGGEMGPDDVLAKTGVLPGQIVEWLAMVGDSADNIPGVPGIGKKTAARLLETFGSLDGVWARLSQVKSDRIRSALDGARDTLERNVKMVTLDCAIESGLGWEDIQILPPAVDKLLPFFEEMEFERMARDLREPELF